MAIQSDTTIIRRLKASKHDWHAYSKLSWASMIRGRARILYGEGPHVNGRAPLRPMGNGGASDAYWVPLRHILQKRTPMNYEGSRVAFIVVARNHVVWLGLCERLYILESISAYIQGGCNSPSRCSSFSLEGLWHLRPPWIRLSILYLLKIMLLHLVTTILKGYFKIRGPEIVHK